MRDKREKLSDDSPPIVKIIMYVVILLVVILVCVGLGYWTNFYIKQKKNDADKYLGKNREGATKEVKEEVSESSRETDEDRVRRQFEMTRKKIVSK